MLFHKKISFLSFSHVIQSICLLFILFSTAGCQSIEIAKEEVMKDHLIERHIKHALYKNDTVPKSGYFGVTSQKGVVTLSGVADNTLQMKDAIAIAKRTQGVIRVENTITLKGEALGAASSYEREKENEDQLTEE